MESSRTFPLLSFGTAASEQVVLRTTSEIAGIDGVLVPPGSGPMSTVASYVTFTAIISVFDLGPLNLWSMGERSLGYSLPSEQALVPTLFLSFPASGRTQVRHLGHSLCGFPMLCSLSASVYGNMAYYDRDLQGPLNPCHGNAMARAE
ncbi:uncharacterized protein ARMOST_10520 [Armillaria ostoyae]|uniref:Uncharacterized protein n=1 Tax=Armillaria ostoyae TaxID=47428 RepID=A0A284REI3_ARMOS|nr:uncharacterized protein ARMOST_10520 [Armillaria ostoyae]